MLAAPFPVLLYSANVIGVMEDGLPVVNKKGLNGRPS